MPADRRITVNVEAEGDYNQYGEYVDGAVTPIEVWANRRDRRQEDIAEEGGMRDETRRDWRIRWDKRIASVPTSRLAVVDGAGTFSVLNVVEVTRQRQGQDLRRRLLDVQGVYST